MPNAHRVSASDVLRMSHFAKNRLRNGIVDRRQARDAPSNPREWSPDRVAAAILDWEGGDRGWIALTGYEEGRRREEVARGFTAASMLDGVADSTMIDIAPIRVHVKALIDGGMLTEEIRDTAGFSTETYDRYLYRRHVRRIKAGDARALLGIPVPGSAAHDEDVAS